MDKSQLLEAPNDKRLEQNQRHLLGQPALMQLEFGTNHNHGTTRVIHALAQEVLAEATALALEHVGKRLERPVARARHRPPVTAVVEQRVHRLLQHPFLVADDDFGRLELQQVFQPVIPVDHPAIEIIQIRRGKTPTLKRHQRPQVWRNDRQHNENHPLRPDFVDVKGLDELDALGKLLANLLALGLGHLDVHLLDLLGQIHLGQRVAHRFRPHLSRKRRHPVGFLGFTVFGFAQELMRLQGRVARVDHHVVLVINNSLQFASRHVEDQADAAGHAFEKPNVGYRHRQFDMAHALAAHPREGHLDAAAVAHHPAMFDALVFSARAFPVLDRTENTLAEQATFFGLEGAVVDGFGVLDLPLGPGTDGVGIGDCNRHIFHLIDFVQTE